MIQIPVSKTASKGYAIAAAYVVKKQELVICQNKIKETEIAGEIIRYEQAVAKAKEELKELAKNSPILEAHLILLEDIMLYDGIVNKIKNELDNAELALQRTSDEFAAIFENMEDTYMKERGADMRDVSLRIMHQLKGIQEDIFSGLIEESIVIAKDLTPSEVSQMDTDKVIGLITQEGGITSHVAIIAKSLGIPCMVGVSNLLQKVSENEMMILDGIKGEIILSPNTDILEQYKEMAEEYRTKQKEISELSFLPSQTLDQKPFQICANAGSLEDVKKAALHHIDGIGLFRSEFLYMETNHFPTEDEQFEAYHKAAVLLEGKELIIRTLDIGGDKSLSYYQFDEEENPFLGYRAIRICLKETEIFKPQLKAILRAGIYGNIKIMFPMMVSLEELDQAKHILNSCKEELKKEKKEFKEDIKVGMMIETPASVLLAEDFAQKVDFFSIGTNDLTQYLLATDRGNQKISSLYNSYHPAVLRAIYQTIQAGHKHGITVGMCGEFASDKKAAKLLLGMGLDEFSMAASQAAEIKYELRNTNFEKMQESALEVLKKSTLEEVLNMLEQN